MQRSIYLYLEPANHCGNCPNSAIIKLLYSCIQPIVYVCYCITPQEHLRSYQDWYRLVTVHTHGDFIVLPHCETRPSAQWPDIPLSNIILTFIFPYQSLPYPNNAECQVRKWQVSILKSLVWFEPVRYESPDLPKHDTDALFIQPSLYASYIYIPIII